MQNQNEQWQTEINGIIYESSFEELIQWINEGALLPQDKVRRGNLRWIEAQKVPSLMSFFNAKAQGSPPPVSTFNAPQVDNSFNAVPNYAAAPQDYSENSYHANVIESSPAAVNHDKAESRSAQPNFQSEDSWQPQSTTQSFNEPAPAQTDPPTAASAHSCSMHPELPSVYLCGTCGNGFCSACPKSYGGTVKICPFCGAMCKSVKEVQQKTQAAAQYEYDLAKGFGFDDFFNALAYPFKFKTSLIIGAIMFMLFTLGQGATSMGSFFLAGGGLICWMSANMLTFGVLSHTVDSFAQGKIGVNFMPNFDDFSIWDDVVHPFFLSLAVYIVSFGLVIFVISGALIWGLNRASSTINESYTNPQSTRILTDKNSPVRNNPNFNKQNDLYGDGEMPDEDKIGGMQQAPGDTEDDVRHANETINQYRQKQLESGLGKSPETERKERDEFLSGLMKVGVPLLLLLIVGLLWGLFYFPAACCVAGYTRSFVATLNPTVGLETIKLLGLDYLKIWLMGAAIIIISGIISLVLGLILSPFDMPQVGNVPVKVIGALFTFYFSVVFSVVLGFALYKNADKLNLFKN